MSNKLLKYIVIFQGILIIFAFIALIYGIYSKTSEDNKNYTLKPDQISLKLSTGEQINDIVIINENELMINISGSKKIRALIFGVKENRILTIINK